MSRTRGYLSPSRRSKRLYENGYYQMKRHSNISGICIACNESPSTYGKSQNNAPQSTSSTSPHTSGYEPRNNLPESTSTTSPHTSGYKPRNNLPESISTTLPHTSGYTPKFRSARKPTRPEPTSVASLPTPILRPTCNEGLVNTSSLPLISQRIASFELRNDMPPCHSSETLAAGECVPLKKKTRQTFPYNVELNQESGHQPQLNQSIDYPQEPSVIEVSEWKNIDLKPAPINCCSLLC